MRVCFLGGFSAGGTESACLKIANALSDKHHIFILSTGKMRNTFFLCNKIQFINLHGETIYKRNKEILSFLKEKRIDVLITLEAMTGLFSIIPAKIWGCKHIIWEHANYYQNQGCRWIQIVRQIELLVADAYVVLTERDLNNFHKHFYCKSRIQTIYNIADNATRNTYQIGSKTIISVGHIRRIKNFIVIPDIARIVFKKYPDWRWIIYGNNSGEEYERIQQRLQEFGLNRNVVFYGRCNTMESEYSKAAMYVMTSLQEGLPMVLLEAKSHGLPLLSFDIETGPNEIIRDGINGFLIPPYDIEIMAEKICQLIENDSLRKQFSENAKLDLERFSVDEIRRKWTELLEYVIE